MNAEQIKQLARIPKSTPCGGLVRQYWQPAALFDGFNPALDARMSRRLSKSQN